MNKTLKLALTAMFTALSIVANTFTVPITPSNAVSFTIVVSFLAGIYLGELPAVAVGFLGDLIGAFINPMGPYNFFMALSYSLTGLICAMVYKLKLNRLIKLVIALALNLTVCSIGLNTFGLWLQIIVGVDPSPIGLLQFIAMDKSLIRKSFWVYLGGRLPFMLINCAINGVALGIIQQTKVFDKLLLLIKSRQKQNPKQPQTADNTSKLP